MHITSGVAREDCSFALSHHCQSLQGSAERRAPGLVGFVPAVAYHFCLGLSAKSSGNLLKRHTILIRRYVYPRSCTGSAMRQSPGLVNFVTAVAYFCLDLPAVFTKPWDHLSAKPCTLDVHNIRQKTHKAYEVEFFGSSCAASHRSSYRLECV